MDTTSREPLNALGHTPRFTFAQNYVELAVALGVTRQTLHNWRNLEGAPLANSNGTHDVGEWRRFARRNKLKAAGIPSEGETRLKQRKLLAEVEEREMKLQIKRREWVRIEDVGATWGQLIAGATTLLRQKFEQELPPILAGLDAPGIRIESQRAIDAVLEILHQGL